MPDIDEHLLAAVLRAIHEAEEAGRRTWKVATAPGERLTVPDGGNVATVWGLPVLVDERVPPGAIAVVSDAGAVVARVG